MLEKTRFANLVLAILLLSVCSPQGETRESDTAAQNRALVQRFYEEFDADPSLDVIDRWLAPDYVNHMAGAPEPLDLAAYRETLTPFLTGFSEIDHEVRQVISEGDRVALFVDISMKHTGEFEGLQPTDRTISVSEMLILRIQDGRIAEEWIVIDFASLMRELQADSADG